MGREVSGRVPRTKRRARSALPPPPSPPSLTEVMTWPLLRWELDKLELPSCLPTDLYLLTFGQEDPRAEDEVARGGRQVRSPVPHLEVITR